jgi:hypothetical protein
MRKILIILVVTFTTFISADTLKNEVEIEKLTEEIMLYVGKGEIVKGLDLMAPYLIIPKAEFETTKMQFEMQVPMYAKRFGKTLGAEYISTEKVGTSLIKIIYIQKFERHLMYWNFYFYKPKNSWVLNTFRSNDQMQLLFNN